MSFTSDEQKLTQKFQELLPSLLGFDIDYSGSRVKSTSGKIVRFRVIRSESHNSVIGGTRQRNYGSAIVQIVVPTGSGSAELLSIADSVSALFKNWRNGGLKCHCPSLSGPNDDGAFITGAVDIPFWSDYTT